MAVITSMCEMSDSQKTVHPFFTKLNEQQSPSHDDPVSINTINTPLVGLKDDTISGNGGTLDANATAPPKHRKIRGRGQPRTPQMPEEQEDVQAGQDGDTVEEESDIRRKRRRLSQDGPQVTSPPVQIPASSPQQQDVAMGGCGSEDLLVHASSPSQLPSSQPGAVPSSPPETAAPKKMMQLKAGGRLASPVKLESIDEEVPSKTTAKRRGRKKKEKHLLAILHYATDGETGSRIDHLLSGLERYQPPPPKKKPPVTILPAPSITAKPTTQKPTHPFFGGKPKSAPEPPKPHRNQDQNTARPSAVTPGKLRAQRLQQKIDHEDAEPVSVPFLSGRDRMISRQPGMTHAPWPWKGVVHVRPDSLNVQLHDTTPSEIGIAPVSVATSSKMKESMPIVEPTESLIYHYRRTLDFNQEDFVRPDGFHNAPSSLRVPERTLLTGSQIQSLVDTNVASFSPSHPACSAVFRDIPALTPYDEGRSEPQLWSQKYAPTSADQLLQQGQESLVLRDWMKALTIMAVENSTSKTDKFDHKTKKRRKKAGELDDFIVEGDEEIDSMDTLPEPDPSISSRIAGSQKPSVVQAQRGSGKLSNVILISGPSGCGKSAMVHAVAKELDFEIFEINSSSRRTGKDVLDRVGDMVENHLVQRISADNGNASADEDVGKPTAAFEKALASGRQGTMASFFKAKPGISQFVKKRPPKPSFSQKVQQSVSKSKTPSSHKQSLILLEEVDILFEEDKGFWQTIFSLANSSKRPLILTCNDEDLVPIQAMKLHAILRLSPPPSDLATTYLELIAAKEGHLLARSDILTLYKAKRQDLRATIAELQFWCQMGVGDPRGGLSWIFQRWPPGTGMSKNGQPLRVVSEGTYQSGMGLFGYQLEPSIENSRQEELLSQVWEDWEVDPRDKLFIQSGHQPMDDKPISDDRRTRTQALKDHERLSQTLSDLDTFSSVGLPGITRLDTTDPKISDHTRSNYISGLALLQTPTLLDHASMATRLSVTCSSLASRVYQRSLGISTPHLVDDITYEDSPTYLTRADFSVALEPLAYETYFLNGVNLTWSSLDGPFKAIALDIAPYVRSIAAYDSALESQRAQLGGEGSLARPRKARTTRAARSALEGGQRSLTRRERWFQDTELDLDVVLGTGGRQWPRFGVVSTESIASAEQTEDERSRGDD